jgi:hypothetical protein
MSNGDDLDLGHAFRVIFVQGGQIAIGTAIGAGVLLLVGIVGILLAPILAPVLLYRHVRRERRKARGGGEPPPPV